MSYVVDKILTSDLKVIGRLVDASNASLLANLEGSEPQIQVIYKPIAGERPLWDFTDGNLAHREYAAYLLSEHGGFFIVPKTVLRDGPFGHGMVQEWVEIDESKDVIEYGQSDNAQLRRMALFDAVINNTDRKFGHLLINTNGELKGCDHGVSFHSENKLRTVIWQFAGEKFSNDESALLDNLSKLDLTDIFSKFITQSEIQALSGRISTLINIGTFPEPSNEWPAVPWPPV